MSPTGYSPRGSEYRLLLRQENALRRLAPTALRYGLWTDEETRTAERRLGAEDRVLAAAMNVRINPREAECVLAAAGQSILHPARVADLARRPGVSLAALLRASGMEEERIDEEACDWADVELKYSGYLDRERTAADRLTELEELVIPPSISFTGIAAMSSEAREKLTRIRPTTLGQAGRIPGVSPNDLQNLLREILKARVSRETLPAGEI